MAVIHDGKDKKLQVELANADDEKDVTISVFRYGPKKFAFELGNRPFLGVYLQDLNEDLARYFKVNAESGVLITEVEEDSPAEEAGIKPGDILAKIEDEAVRSAEDVLDILTEYEPGDTVELVLLRTGSEKKLKVELDKSQSGAHLDQLFEAPDLNDLELDLPQFEDHFRHLPRFKMEIRERKGIRENFIHQYDKQKLEILRRVEIIQHKLNDTWNDLKEGFLRIVSFKNKSEPSTVVWIG